MSRQAENPQLSEDSTTKDSSGSKPGIAKAFRLVAIVTVFSKVIGLVRDIILTSAYGTSIIADAYNYATLFTGNILILFGGLGGPFHSSTVTVLTQRKDDRDSGQLMSQILALTFIILGAITLLLYLLAPSLIPYGAAQYGVKTKPGSLPDLSAILAMHAPVLSDTQKLFSQQVLVQLDIMLPLVVLAGLVGVSYGILNVYNKIFWPSLSPTIASLAIIIAIGLSDPKTRLITGVPLAVGTLAGAIGQFLAQLPAMSKLDLNWSLKFKPQPGLSEYAKMLWPAFFSTSVGQLTVYVDAYFAGQTEGAWTAVITSNRLVQLPLGILLTAMLVPMLPRFTEQAFQNRHDDLKEELRRALRVLWFLALPVTAGLIVLPREIIEVLFQRGHFNADSARLVTTALIFLVPSIFFYVARDLVTRVFYAFQDSTTPYHIAIVAIFVKALLDWFLVQYLQLGVAGLSTATTIMTIFNLSLLTFFLRHKIGHLGARLLIKPLATMITASVACAAIIYFAYHGLASVIPGAEVHGALSQMQVIVRLIILSIAGGAGLAAYVVVCLLFRLDEPMMVAKRVPILHRYLPGKRSD